MKRFIRMASGQVLDLNKVKLCYSVYTGANKSGQSFNEFIGYGDEIIWIQNIEDLMTQSDDPLDLIEPKKDMLEVRRFNGIIIRTHLGFIKSKNEKQSAAYKYQLDGAQCLPRHIKAIWFRVGNTFERLELEVEKKIVKVKEVTE